MKYKYWENGEYHNAEGIMAIIYLVNFKKKNKYKIGMADTDNGLLNILQWLIDSMSTGLSDIIVEHSENHKIITGEQIIKKYGIRKRTFQERLDNVKTWKTGDKLK